MSHSRLRTVLEMIKFEHSVFALPFALTGALLAARYATIAGTAPGLAHCWRQILWIVVAMVGARSAAMTWNRIVDLRFDRANPRTRTRALATGARSSVGFAWMFTIAGLRGAGVRGVATESSRARTSRPSRSPCCSFIRTRNGLHPGHTLCWVSAWECRRLLRGSPLRWFRSTSAC